MWIKTLKDIETIEGNCEQCYDEYCIHSTPPYESEPGVLIKDLKKQAIKWIKYYREEYGDNLPSYGFSPDIEFMKFFNLTESDVNVLNSEVEADKWKINSY